MGGYRAPSPCAVVVLQLRHLSTCGAVVQGIPFSPERRPAFESRGACARQGLEEVLQQEMPTGRGTPEQYPGRNMFQRSATLDYGPRGFGDSAGRPPPASYYSHQHGSNVAY